MFSLASAVYALKLRADLVVLSACSAPSVTSRALRAAQLDTLAALRRGTLRVSASGVPEPATSRTGASRVRASTSSPSANSVALPEHPLILGRLRPRRRTLTDRSRRPSRMDTTLYMVIEHFKNGDAVPVYRRFRDRGRLAPEGLTYVSSWVDTTLRRCYQVMETTDRRLLDQWIANWSDVADFEVIPVITSKEAAERIAPRL